MSAAEVFLLLGSSLAGRLRTRKETPFRQILHNHQAGGQGSTQALGQDVQYFADFKIGGQGIAAIFVP